MQISLRKRILIMFMAFVMAFSLVPSLWSYSYADEEEDKKEELEQVQEEQDQVSEDLNALTAEIEAKEQEISDLEDAIDKKTAQVKKTKESLEKTKQDLADREEAFENRVRAMYENGSVGYIEILLGSKNVSDLISNVDMVKRIYRNDQKVIKEIEEDQKQLEYKQEKLKQEKAELDAQEKELETAKASLDVTKAQLQTKYDELQEQIENLRKEIIQIQEAKRVLGASGLNIDLPIKYTGGKFCWPCVGPITSQFGEARSYESHPGIDIGVPTGTPIHAAADGVVIRSSYYGGYGNCVVISHGDGLVTLYGHNSSLNCSVGQSVKQGDVIAYAGSTGWSTGPHCHFEVQVNGQVTNPLNYLN